MVIPGAEAPCFSVAGIARTEVRAYLRDNNKSKCRSKTRAKALRLAEEEFFGAEFFYCVAEFGGFFEFEFFGGFAHVGF